MSKPSIPEQKTPAAAPAPVVVTPAARQLGDERRTKESTRKKRGRKSLRIDPQTGGIGGGAGAGINVPQK